MTVLVGIEDLKNKLLFLNKSYLSRNCYLLCLKTVQSYYSTAKFRPSTDLSINSSMGALLEICIAIFKACLALSSYFLKFKRNIWIGNKILSIIQLYNTMRTFFYEFIHHSKFQFKDSEAQDLWKRDFWINKPFFYLHTIWY